MKHLTKRIFSAFVCAVLLLSHLCPALAVSAKEDPLVPVASFGGLNDDYLEYRYNTQGQVVELTNRSTKEVTEITYHSSGKVKKERTLYYNKVTKVREYDYNGNILKVSHADQYGNMVDDQVYTNKYDENGRLIYIYMRKELSHHEARFSYNPDGSFMVDWDYYHMNGNQKEPFMHRIGHFTKEGKMVHQTIDLEYSMPHNSVWNLTLDSYGNPAVETAFFSDADISTATITYYVNEYDKSGALLSVEKHITEYSSSESAPASRTENIYYAYDSKGRLIKQSDSKNFDGMFDYRWEYDTNDCLVFYTGMHQVCSDLDMFMMRNEGAMPQYGDIAYEYYPLSKALK